MNSTVTARVETEYPLTIEEGLAIRTAAYAINAAAETNPALSLDDAEQGFRNMLRDMPLFRTGWLVYRGGSHVAFIKGTERIVLVVEGRPEPLPEPDSRCFHCGDVVGNPAAHAACQYVVEESATGTVVVPQTTPVAPNAALQAMIDGTYDQKGPVLPAIVAEPGYGRYTFYPDRRSYGQPEPYKARIEAKAETINALHLTDLTALRQTLRQEFPGFKFEQEPGLLIMSRPLSNSPSLVCSQPLTCAEANIRPGQTFDIHVNQGNREAEVLAVDGRRYLVEYTMPKGTTALQVFTVGIIGGKSVSYTGLTIAWLQALVAADRGWVANPQKGPFGIIPSPAEQLAAKKGGR